MLDGEKRWVQPILTSNGTWEVDDFAVRGMGDGTYLAFDGTTNYLNGTNTDSYIEIWIKDGLALGEVVLMSSDGYLTTRGILAYSDDGKNYIDCGTWSADNGDKTTVICTNHDVHKYFRLTFKSSCDYRSGNANISNVTLVDYETSSHTTPVALTFDGSTNYAKVPVSLTDVSDWSAEITFTTTENDWSSRVYHQPCIFGYDTGGASSRDFHVDTRVGNLYVFNGLGNSSAPVGGKASWDNGDCGVDTGIKVNDGKKHKVKVVSTTGKIEVYCDGTLATTVYPTTTLSADAFYIGCSKPSESVFGHLTLYSFSLTKNGKTVAEYEPTVEEAITDTITDNSGNGNNATLYGEFHICASGIPRSATEVLATDTSSTPIAVIETKPDSVSGIPLALCLVNHDSASCIPRSTTEIIATDTSGAPIAAAEVKPKNYDFVQPTLTADGKFGEDAFAVRAGGETQTAWGAFTDVVNTYASNISNGSYIDIYTAIPIVIDYIKISSNGNMPAYGIIEYSDDGEVFTPCGKWEDRDKKGIWDVAFCDDNSGHCYWRVKSTADSRSSIAKLDIYANKSQYTRKRLIKNVNGIDWRAVALINEKRSNKIFKLNGLNTSKIIVI